MTDPTIKVKRLAYVRVGAPDVATAEKFLHEFGLHVAARADDEVHFRGTDAEAPCYVLAVGAGGVTAIAFEADSYEDLERMAQLEGASAIEALQEPAGGWVVRLIDPVGMQVEIVYGRDALEPLEPAPAHAFNMNGLRERVGQLPAVKRGPSRVRRIGHLVLESADPEMLYRWYHERFGLTISDAVRLPDNSAQMIFSRLDRAEEFVDHHVVGFQFALDEGVRVQHVAFEVGNLDDLMSGHEHLKRCKRKHVWGIGRHLLGGQIFDYWRSPFGLIHEHWTDTDLVNQTHEAGDCGIAKMEDYWGPGPTPGFLIARWNFKATKNLMRLVRARSQSAAG
jgi:catechol 2,3-dioxygenase-like lactoylglutathione lyase family enzyme